MSVKVSNDENEEIERIKLRTLQEMQRQATAKQTRADALTALGGKAMDLMDSTFHSTVKKYPLMLVDFWAPWCMPCRLVSPAVDQLAKEYAGKIAFGRINVDDNPMTANQFRVQGIPTLMILKQGSEVDRLVGAYPKNMIDAQLRAHLQGSSTHSSEANR